MHVWEADRDKDPPKLILGNRGFFWRARLVYGWLVGGRAGSKKLAHNFDQETTGEATFGG